MLLSSDNGTALTVEGDVTITTPNIQGGVVNSNQISSGCNAITTATLLGGILTGAGSREARTWATVNVDEGTLIVDDAVVTITTLDQPAGERTIAVS